jgi:hypothetical protein
MAEKVWWLISLAVSVVLAGLVGLQWSLEGFGVNSALFFVVIIAHVQLRRQFLGSGLVYNDRKRALGKI